MIQVSVRTVETLMAGRRIPYLKINGTVRFRPDKVLEALENFEIEAIQGPRR